MSTWAGVQMFCAGKSEIITGSDESSESEAYDVQVRKDLGESSRSEQHS